MLLIQFGLELTKNIERAFNVIQLIEEKISINERNSDFEYVDSWFEKIEKFLNETTLELVTTERIHELLDLDPRHLSNNSISPRIKKIMFKCGWKYGRPTIDGEQQRGYIKGN